MTDTSLVLRNLRKWVAAQILPEGLVIVRDWSRPAPSYIELAPSEWKTLDVINGAQ